MFTHAEVIQEIKNLNVVAKTVSLLSNQDEYFSTPDRVLYLLKRLADTSYFRPTKGRKIDIERDRRVQFQNRELTIRPKKNCFFTKKTATTLVPRNGNIDLYMPKKKAQSVFYSA